MRKSRRDGGAGRLRFTAKIQHGGHGEKRNRNGMEGFPGRVTPRALEFVKMETYKRTAGSGWPASTGTA